MASIIGNPNFCQIIVTGFQGSDKTTTFLRYFPTSGTGSDTAADMASQFITDVVPAWLAAVSEKWRMAEINVVKFVAGVPQQRIVAIDDVGDIVGDALPVYNTFSLRRYPDNGEKDPVGASDFKIGRKAISGVAESTQNNGIINPAHEPIINVLGAALQQIVTAGSTYTMFMPRFDLTGNLIAAVPITLVEFGRMGTQNTRKD